jgi:hypothetical protein
LDREDIRSLLEAVRADCGSAIPIGSVHEYWRVRNSNADISEDDQEFTLEFVLWAAGPYTELSGWLVRHGDLVSSTASALHRRLDARGWLSSEVVKEELNRAGISEKYHVAWMAEHGAFLPIDGGWLPLVRTIPDRAEQLLRYGGVPMLAETLYGLVGCESERSLRQRLLDDGRFKRISRQGHFALREWAQYDEYTGIAAEIVEEIERQGGSARPQHIIDALSVRYGVKPNSVAQYLSAPMFLKTPDGFVRLREPDEVIRILADPKACQSLYLIDGHWTLRVEITDDTLRGSGRPLNAGIAAVVGCQPGERRVFRTLRDEIVVSWPAGSASGPNLGSLKPDVDAEGGKVGDFVFLTFIDSDIRVRLLSAASLQDASPITKLALLIGLPLAIATSSNPWGIIATAVGLGDRPGTYGADDVYAALMRRNEVTLASLIHGETADAAVDIFKRLEGILGL